MMAWIESHEELPTHRKTRRVARQLGASVPAVLGHLHCLWYWCLTHAPDGRLEGFDDADLADAAMWEGDPEPFATALLEAGWLDAEDDCWVVHGWWDGAGKTILRRKHATERQRRARASRELDEPSDESHDSHGEVTRDSRTGHGADSDIDSDSDKNPKNSSSAVADPKVSDDARRLTRTFAVAVKANGFKVPKREQKAYADWLTDMDRLLRLGAPGGDPDPQQPGEVEKVIRYATADGFWKANIGSPSKLREQYPKLRLRMLNGNGTRPRQDAKAAQYGPNAK